MSDVTPEPKDSSGVAVIDRACAILFAFKPDDSALTLAELAARTGLYKSTLLRLAGALIQHRMLMRLDDGRYQLGPATFMLGALYQRSLNLGDILLPLMRELADVSGESVSFYVRDDAVRVCLHRVDSTHAVRFHVREGDVLPLEHGSGDWRCWPSAARRATSTTAFARWVTAFRWAIASAIRRGCRCRCSVCVRRCAA
ncbi:IclR family transcriptional regulator [Pandoraea sputorum]|uniref:IclR family transcriptional regulator n=1 Tax=Pandoraea sputorum TaxID=93222 RepID=UPI00211D6DEE|nr:helix-turn-helix domain-containing protein [Pandoraea sputorum]